ncbi:MAG: acetylxylan esterase [Candidatus Latescibacteria bacterium]|nr:acetylxylan esterase [Candidatus Latescibacterota bacterium]
MTQIFDQHQLPALLCQGGMVDKDGLYTFWLWAPPGSQAVLVVNGSPFEPTHTGVAAPWFTWVRAGQVALHKGQTFSVELRVHQALGATGGFGLALSAENSFDPRRSFEVTRVFHRQPGPGLDRRWTVKDGDTPWTLRQYPSRAAWEARAAHIRQRLLVSLGLWPLPERTPLKARIFGRLEREGYSVEKVCFESLPGFLVCGNLYRPAGKGPFPGILSPHGHWRDGRLEHSADCSIPGRCINLARQGHVVFAYDMIGYLDSDQLSHHPELGRREALWGIGLMGLQLWNSMRSVDFLLSLEDVDPERIGCTGASGGGTQTFALTAVDDRVKAAAPVNMVSAHMQGGCGCENQGHLRLELNNVEIAACMAPRPLLLVSATGDWTCDTPDVEYPAIRRVYQLYGAEERVSERQFDAGHNFHQGSREAVYAFFAKWFLGIDDPQRCREKPFVVEKREDLLVFSGPPRPAHALDQAGLVRSLIERSEKLLADLKPSDGPSLNKFKKALAPALRHALSLTAPAAAEVEAANLGRSRRPGLAVQRLLLSRRGEADQVPALFYLPRPLKQGTPALLVVHPQGKAALADAGRGQPGPVVADLLAQGYAVLAIDAFLTGEGRVARGEGSPHFTTYNQTTTACRVQDILTALAYLESCEEVGAVDLLGLEEAGPWCLLARGLASGVRRAAIDFNYLPAGDDQVWAEQLFVPALRRVGDLRTALVLAAPGALLVHQAGKGFPEDWARAAYRAAGKEEQLLVSGRRLKWEAVLAWLKTG